MVSSGGIIVVGMGFVILVGILIFVCYLIFKEMRHINDVKNKFNDGMDTMIKKLQK